MKYIKDMKEKPIDEYRSEARFIGAGGESEVYQMLKRPDIVVKLGYNWSIGQIEKNLDKQKPYNYADESSLIDYGKEVEQRNQKFAQFRHFFGKHALVEKSYLVKMPDARLSFMLASQLNPFHTDARPRSREISRKIREQSPEDADNLTLKDVFTIVTIQRKFDAKKYTSRLEFSVPYFDSSTSSVLGWDGLSSLMQAAVITRGANDPRLARFVRNSIGLKTIKETVDSDDDFRRVVEDFLGRMEEYSRQTGEILDLNGEGNVVFHKEKDVWNYKLVDAFFARGKSSWLDKLEELAEQIEKNGAPSDPASGRIVVKNVVHYVLLLKSLGEIVGRKSGIEPLNIGLKIKNIQKVIDWYLNQGPESG